VAFTQVPIQIPDVFQNLKRYDSVGRLAREVGGPTRLQKHINVSLEITRYVLAILRSKERLIRAVATPHVDDDL